MIAAESVNVLTCLEVCEHLTGSETQEFIAFTLRVLAPRSRLLVSVPIEMGPAVLVKELSRSMLHRRRPDLTAAELARVAFRAKPARRADDIKSSHRGFDWRVTRYTLRQHLSCEHVKVLAFAVSQLVRREPGFDALQKALTGHQGAAPRAAGRL